MTPVTKRPLSCNGASCRQMSPHSAVFAWITWATGEEKWKEAERRARMPREGMMRQDREKNQAAASGLEQTNEEAGHCPAEAVGGLITLSHGIS